MRRGLIWALALGGMSVGAAVIAATPQDVITARQQHYKDIGKASKAIGDELKKDAPSMDVVQANAKTLDSLAPQIPSWFPAGTGPESGVKTAALPAIWSQNADFQKDAKDFATAVHALNTAAASGNVAQINATYKTVGDSCRTCHMTFRARDQH